jgi:glutamate-1-semialdehyde 2,1-aminomutase
MFTVFFTKEDVFDFTSAAKSDTSIYARYFRQMLENKIYLAPSQFEAAFLSFAHGDEDIEKTLHACERTLKDLAKRS